MKLITPSPRIFGTLLLFACLTSPVLAQKLVGVRNGNQTLILTGEGPLARIEPSIFEPGFAWIGGKIGTPQTEGTMTRFVTEFTTRKTPGLIRWEETLGSVGDGLRIDVKATADHDIPMTYGALAISAESQLQGGQAEVTLASGETKTYPLPFPRDSLSGVKSIRLFKSGVPEIRVDLTEPRDAAVDGNIRLKVVGELIAANSPATAQLRVSSGAPIEFFTKVEALSDPVDISKWFAFEPSNSVDPGGLGMQEWMGIPKKFLEVKGDQVLFDGKPFKIWGTNVEYAATKPEAQKAEKLAAWFAKWGVNVVRQHKLTNPGWEGLGSTKSASEFEPKDLERFDYFNFQLRKHGVLYGFSPIWNLKIFEGDRDKLVAYDELVQKGAGAPDTRGLVWFMEDVQDLHIKTMLNLLNHTNSHTGLRYADDPALAFVEMQNEEDVFFFTTISAVTKYPTYKRLIGEKFSDWLKAKYGTQEALVAAWGKGLNGMKTEGGAIDESLVARNILPLANPWHLDNWVKNHPVSQRMKDTADFKLESQNRYYQRMAQAIRKAGYGGPLIASNWQAGETTGHFYNLSSDADIGVIDRHNYLAGADGNPNHEMHTGHPFSNATTLDDPGGALLSTGMQQVANRPFSMSEWLAIPPHEWAAAETAIIAVYGMGLQGWDMSYHFASNNDGFTPTVNFPGKKKFNNQTLHGIGMFPVLGRMLLRGDIREGDVIARRNITLAQARDQSYDFENKSIQAHDLKSFDGTPGRAALAVGRVLVDFIKEPKPSEIQSLESFRKGDTLISNTDQLQWTNADGKENGFITINSPGTQGVIGFAPDQSFPLDDMKVQTKNNYAVVMATAMKKDQSLANCDEALVLAIARVRNQGMKLNYGLILDLGSAPTIVEPVSTSLEFKRTPKEVIALSADGMPTEQRLTIEGRSVKIDTAQHKAVYYLVRF